MAAEGDIPNHVLDSARDFVGRLNAAPEDEKLQTLLKQIDHLSPVARDYLQFLTNTFLEKDILDKTMQNPDSVEEIRSNFVSYGASKEQAALIIDYFNKGTEDQSSTAPEQNDTH